MTNDGFSVDIERVRELAFAAAPSDDDVLNFYAPARSLGASDAEAERIDMILTRRIMRARGAL
jgi:hypothetical protein